MHSAPLNTPTAPPSLRRSRSGSRRGHRGQQRACIRHCSEQDDRLSVGCQSCRPWLAPARKQRQRSHRVHQVNESVSGRGRRVGAPPARRWCARSAGWSCATRWLWLMQKKQQQSCPALKSRVPARNRHTQTKEGFCFPASSNHATQKCRSPGSWAAAHVTARLWTERRSASGPAVAHSTAVSYIERNTVW